ncbi:hypothetical protein VTI74DRAFT_3334 [Chaetomium olivicolor]
MRGQETTTGFRGSSAPSSKLVGINPLCTRNGADVSLGTKAGSPRISFPKLISGWPKPRVRNYSSYSYIVARDIGYLAIRAEYLDRIDGGLLLLRDFKAIIFFTPRARAAVFNNGDVELERRPLRFFRNPSACPGDGYVKAMDSKPDILLLNARPADEGALRITELRLGPSVSLVRCFIWSPSRSSKYHFGSTAWGESSSFLNIQVLMAAAAMLEVTSIRLLSRVFFWILRSSEIPATDVKARKVIKGAKWFGHSGTPLNVQGQP